MAAPASSVNPASSSLPIEKPVEKEPKEKTSAGIGGNGSSTSSLKTAAPEVNKEGFCTRIKNSCSSCCRKVWDFVSSIPKSIWDSVRWVWNNIFCCGLCKKDQTENDKSTST